MCFVLFCFILGLTCVYSLRSSHNTVSPLNAMYGFRCLFYNGCESSLGDGDLCMVLFELNVITFACVCVLMILNNCHRVEIHQTSNVKY